MKVAIIGGGAAGFFAAITVKENYPEASVVIYEKTKNVLAKVKISGGGRCNLSHATKDIKELAKAYPRGERQLRKSFGLFSNIDTMKWFASRGVALVTQEDGCVFPKSQNSQTIINCFLDEAIKHDIKIETEKPVKALQVIDNSLKVHFKEDSLTAIFDKVIVATGGSPKLEGLTWLADLNHKITLPVPSLFTFNLPDEPITKLMGIVVKKAILSIQGTKIKATGDLLITHWGMSGPVVLRLSSFGARLIKERDYYFKIQVNWVNTANNELVAAKIEELINQHPKKKLGSVKPYHLPVRLWEYLLERTALPLDRKWNEIGKKGIHKIVNILTNDIYSIAGKTKFKEEFVTAGGVSLEEVDFKTMQSKKVKNLYFAGEVLDVDGITGGYNFQAAWTTAFIAGKLKPHD